MESLNCSKDTKKSQNREYQRQRKTYIALNHDRKKNIKISDLNETYKTKLNFKSTMNSSSGKCKKAGWGIGERNEGNDGNAGNRGRNHFSD